MPNLVRSFRHKVKQPAYFPPAVISAPTILTFTVLDNPVSQGVETTFSWTLGGDSPDEVVLNPGDGSSPYSMTTQLSRTHTYTTPGSYTATLLALNSAGTDTDTIDTVVVAVSVSASDFTQFTTFKSEGSGAHWVSPFGIPVPRSSTVVTERKTRIVAQVSGVNYPVQTEGFSYRSDGSLHYCAGHLKLPSSYTANTTVAIGFSDTYSFPSTPDWDALFTAFDAGGNTFTVSIETYEPQIYWVAAPGDADAPFSGDTITVSISASSGTRSYSQFVERGFSYNYQRHTFTGAVSYTWGMPDLLKQIHQDPSSLYMTYDREAVHMRDWKRNIPAGYDSFLPRYQNSQVQGRMGWPGGRTSHSYAPRRSATEVAWWPGAGFYIWPRWRAGEPETYEVRFSVARNGVNLPCAAVNGNNTGPGDYSRKLNYDNRTAAFQNGGIYVVGVTSGTVAYVHSFTGTTSGTLRVNGVKGPGFLDNEALVFEDSYGVTVPGACLVNGTLTYQLVTSSSGGSAKLICGPQEGVWAYAVIDVTGTFANGDTLTFENAFTTTMTGTPVYSTGSLYVNPTTKAQSGAIAPINTPTNRRTWVASWTLGTSVPDSPYFSGHQVQQRERRCTFVATDNGQVHPHLDAWMAITLDRTGTVIDRQMTLKHATTNAMALQYWYDAKVRVNGASMTPDDFRYRQMYHMGGQSWRWQSTHSFGMCDPGDFMKGRSIFPWPRYPTWSVLQGMSGKVRGKQVSWTTNLTSTDAIPYVRDNYNDPLFPSNLDFGQLGGSRGELGDYNSWEYMFWAGNSIEAWPAMRAMADNCASTQQMHYLDYDASGDDYLAVPHLLKRWRDHPGNWGAAAGGRSYTRAYEGGYFAATGVTQLYRMSPIFNPINSHAPSVGCFSAWLARPEKRFKELQECYSWFMAMNGQSGNLLHPNKIGEVDGGPNHLAGFQNSNGNRTYARIAKEIFKAAIIHTEGARRRAFYRKIAQDMANYAEELVTKTVWGAFHVRRYLDNSTFGNSNTYGTATPLLYGQEFPTSAFPDGFGLDYFKSAYIHMTMWLAKDWNIANVDTYINRSIWPMLMFDRQPLGKPWLGLPGNVSGRGPFVFVSNLEWKASTSQWVTPTASTPRLWSASNMSDLTAWLSTLTTVQRDSFGLNYTYSDFLGYVSPGDCNYSIVKQTYGAFLAYKTYGTDESIRTIAQAGMDYIDAAAPIHTVRAESGYGGLTNAQIQQQLGFVDYDEVVNW